MGHYKKRQEICNYTTRPGAHKKHYSVPSAVFLRDMLKIVTSLREAKTAIYSGKVKIDGVVRKSLHHAIGLMDVVELENVSDIYRLVPTEGKLLKPIKINESEKSKKLVKLQAKQQLTKEKCKLVFMMDVQQFLRLKSVNVGDTCLIEVPESKNY